MRLILITTFLACAFSCHANVSRGRGDTYCVDQWGDAWTQTEPKNRHIKFIPESDAKQSTSFKSFGPTALY